MTRAAVERVSEMTPRERALYENYVAEYEERYSDPEVWGPIIAKWLNSKFKSTRIVGKANFEDILPK